MYHVVCVLAKNRACFHLVRGGCRWELHGAGQRRRQGRRWPGRNVPREVNIQRVHPRFRFAGRPGSRFAGRPGSRSKSGSRAGQCRWSQTCRGPVVSGKPRCTKTRRRSGQTRRGPVVCSEPCSQVYVGGVRLDQEAELAGCRAAAAQVDHAGGSKVMGVVVGIG